MTAAAGAERTQRFPSRHRLRKRHEFLALQRDGRRYNGTRFVVITRPAATGGTRLGITTSRKVGAAPRRNRIRRLVREFFRRHRAQIEPPRELLVIARPGIDAITYDDVVHELSRALGLAAGV